MARWGCVTNSEIDKSVEELKPYNTKKTEKYVWKQFMDFLATRKVTLSSTTTVQQLDEILKDWAFNMRKTDGSDYKEGVVKTIWNISAKHVQKLYSTEYNTHFDPFKDVAFQHSRLARDRKRQTLQMQSEKRKESSTAFTFEQRQKIYELWDGSCPKGLIRKLFHILSFELSWRGGEGSKCRVSFFKEELDNYGIQTNRIEYNPILTKTSQGGARALSDSKWLIQNRNDPTICPVTLFRLYMLKRPSEIKHDKFFLTPNVYWKEGLQLWFKRTPLGPNELSKWTTEAAKDIGLDIVNKKFTNHSYRHTAVSHLSKGGVTDAQLIKITGHKNINSIRPYLQIDPAQHDNIINQMRGSVAVSSTIVKDPVVPTATEIASVTCRDVTTEIEKATHDSVTHPTMTTEIENKIHNSVNAAHAELQGLGHLFDGQKVFYNCTFNFGTK